eukprot:700223-Rhodomonas_salina.4
MSVQPLTRRIAPKHRSSFVGLLAVFVLACSEPVGTATGLRSAERSGIRPPLSHNFRAWWSRRAAPVETMRGGAREDLHAVPLRATQHDSTFFPSGPQDRKAEADDVEQGTKIRRMCAECLEADAWVGLTAKEGGGEWLRVFCKPCFLRLKHAEPDEDT